MYKIIFAVLAFYRRSSMQKNQLRFNSYRVDFHACSELKFQNVLAVFLSPWLIVVTNNHFFNKNFFNELVFCVSLQPIDISNDISLMGGQYKYIFLTINHDEKFKKKISATKATYPYLRRKYWIAQNGSLKFANKNDLLFIRKVPSTLHNK